MINGAEDEQQERQIESDNEEEEEDARMEDVRQTQQTIKEVTQAKQSFEREAERAK